MVERVDRAVVRLDREIEVRRQREELVPHAEIVPSLNRKVPADGVRGSTRSEEGRAPDSGLGGGELEMAMMPLKKCPRPLSGQR